MSDRYRGRFAPSPTGPLHFGSLVAAVTSYLQARHQHGEWLLRIEDIDPPREIPGASDDIVRTLDNFGFEWDGEIVYQSQRSELYNAALAQLAQQNKLFACTCSRKVIAKQNSQGVYPGTCRHKLVPTHGTYSWRIRCDDRDIKFRDGLQGEISCALCREVGDFVLKRADGFFAYHLAVTIDDVQQGITEVVRGCDLLNCTAQQIYLQQLLGYSSPRYLHHPIALNAQGQKLSKQNQAPALDTQRPLPQLWQALVFLQQSPPVELKGSSLADLWQWAIEHWQLSHVPHISGKAIEEIPQMSDKD